MTSPFTVTSTGVGSLEEYNASSRYRPGLRHFDDVFHPLIGRSQRFDHIH